jgi:hypothetical protein
MKRDFTSLRAIPLALLCMGAWLTTTAIAGATETTTYKVCKTPSTCINVSMPASVGNITSVLPTHGMTNVDTEWITIGPKRHSKCYNTVNWKGVRETVCMPIPHAKGLDGMKLASRINRAGLQELYFTRRDGTPASADEQIYAGNFTYSLYLTTEALQRVASRRQGDASNAPATTNSMLRATPSATANVAQQSGGGGCSYDDEGGTFCTDTGGGGGGGGGGDGGGDGGGGGGGVEPSSGGQPEGGIDPNGNPEPPQEEEIPVVVITGTRPDPGYPGIPDEQEPFNEKLPEVVYDAELDANRAMGQAGVRSMCVMTRKMPVCTVIGPKQTVDPFQDADTGKPQPAPDNRPLCERLHICIQNTDPGKPADSGGGKGNGTTPPTTGTTGPGNPRDPENERFERKVCNAITARKSAECIALYIARGFDKGFLQECSNKTMADHKQCYDDVDKLGGITLP